VDKKSHTIPQKGRRTWFSAPSPWIVTTSRGPVD